MEAVEERVYNTEGLKKDERDGSNRKKSVVEMMHWNNKSDKAEESEDELLVAKSSPVKLDENGPTDLPTIILKKNKLKINVHRTVGKKVKYDEDANQIDLSSFAILESTALVTEPEEAWRE